MSLRSKTFTVTLIDNLDKTPVAGATVTINYINGSRQTVTSNSYGQFSFTLTQKNNQATLVIQSSIHQTLSHTVYLTDPSSITLTLTRLTRSVTVYVRDSNNNPIPNASVGAIYRDVEIIQGTTDSTGGVVLNLYINASYTLYASATNYEPAFATVSVPASGTIAPVYITLRPMVYRFTLIVVNNSNAPIVGATVTVENLNKGTSSTYFTDSQGRAEVQLDDNTSQYRVTVRRSGMKTVVRSYHASQIVNSSDTIILEPTKLMVIVVDSQNRSVSGALVRVIKDGQEIGRGFTT